MSLSDEIKSKALELGFDLAGITDAGAIGSEQVEILRMWLESGCAGQMTYMQRNFDKRVNPSKLLDNAQSVIVVGLNYNPPEMVRYNRTQHGRIASYAQYEDYHFFIKKRLCELADFIVSLTDKNLCLKICVDSVQLAERTLAVKAGLGFIGKNHMLINPELGCKIFLGEIITDMKLDYDEPMVISERTCSNCDKCVKLCPTGALSSVGLFDASRCINYLTIEYKGEIPPELAGKISNKLFGCEECINICPYQKNAPVCYNMGFKFYPDRAQMNLEEVSNLSEEQFKKKFRDSVIRRPGLDLLKRNARICIGNIESGKLFNRTSS